MPRIKCTPHLFHPVGVPLSSALTDIHLCRVDTAWLWRGGGAGCLEPSSRLSLFKIHSDPSPQISSHVSVLDILRSLTTGRWTSQNALSWLSRIFLSALSFFLSILASAKRHRRGNASSETQACEITRQRGQSGQGAQV